MIVTGTNYTYELPDGYVSPFIYDVTMTGLISGVTYYYFCGDQNGGWSNVYTFKSESTEPVSSSDRVVIASIADHGTSPNSSMVLNALTKYHQETPLDFLYLAGDISYANGLQVLWDKYGNMIQPMTSIVPWMVGAGNHELFWGFIPYTYRFDMPGVLYYSFNYRNVHMISLNSEEPLFWHSLEQYQWLEADLKSVNRTETPWILVGFHTPWYCSNIQHNDSGADMRFYFEDLFYKYGVDLVLNGHVHAYERTAPIYQWQVNPNGPVYIVNGCGGTAEGLYKHWEDPSPKWSLSRHSEWGFGMIEIYNSTHLTWEFYRAQTQTVLDSAWIVRNH